MGAFKTRDTLDERAALSAAISPGRPGVLAAGGCAGGLSLRTLLAPAPAFAQPRSLVISLGSIGPARVRPESRRRKRVSSPLAHLSGHRLSRQVHRRDRTAACCPLDFGDHRACRARRRQTRLGDLPRSHEQGRRPGLLCSVDQSVRRPPDEPQPQDRASGFR
jgi:hypothetical protein